MTFDEVINKFSEIFQEVLEDEDIELTYETTADDIDEWDSINHITLVVEIEKAFNVSFSAKEIRGFENVGEMCDGILKKFA